MAKEFIIKNGLIINGTHAVTGITNESGLTFNSATLVTEDAIKKYHDYYNYWNLSASTLKPKDSSYSVNIENTTTSSSNTTGALVVGGGVGIGENISTAGSIYFDNDGSINYLDLLGSSEYDIRSRLFYAEGNNYSYGIRVANYDNSYDSNSGVIGFRWYDISNNNMAIHLGGTKTNRIDDMPNEQNLPNGNNANTMVHVGIDENIGYWKNDPDAVMLRIKEYINYGGQDPDSRLLLVDDGSTDYFEVRADGDVKIGNSTSSTSFTTGALVVNGGIGIGENLNVGGLFGLNSGTTIYNISTDSGFTSADDDSISTSLAIKDYIDTNISSSTYWSLNSSTLSPENSGYTVNIENTTGSTSPTTGALVVGGGVGIGNDLWLGGQLNISGNTFRMTEKRTINNSGDTGLKGEISWDENYLYICVADNTWKRVSLASW